MRWLEKWPQNEKITLYCVCLHRRCGVSRVAWRLALEETDALLGGSSHHYDTSNLPACCSHIGASSGVLCTLVGEKGGRRGDGARMLLAQQVDLSYTLVVAAAASSAAGRAAT